MAQLAAERGISESCLHRWAAHDDIDTGKVIGSLRSRHRAVEVGKFLRKIDAEVRTSCASDVQIGGTGTGGLGGPLRLRGLWVLRVHRRRGGWSSRSWWVRTSVAQCSQCSGGHPLSVTSAV